MTPGLLRVDRAWFPRLKLQHDAPFSSFSVIFNLRHFVKGYTCDSDDKFQCYGVTGTQVLDSIGNNYKSISSDNNVAMDCGIMLAIGGVFMIAYIVLLQIKTTSVKLVKLPAK